MPLYQLTLFYPSLESHQKTVREVRTEIESVARNNWRVLSAGERICAIGFVTEAQPQDIESRLRRFGSDTFCYLLVEIAAVRGGVLPAGAFEWLAGRLPMGSRK